MTNLYMENAHSHVRERYFLIQQPKNIQASIEEYLHLGFKPRVDCSPHKLSLPIDWLNNPFNDRNWMFQLQSWRMLDPFLLRFRTEDARYIRHIISDWALFEKETPEDKAKEWLWYDMAAGLRALKLALFAWKCAKSEMDIGIHDFEVLLSKHVSHLTCPAELNKGNHGLFQLHGLMCLLYYFHRSPCIYSEEGKNYAEQEMRALIFTQMGEHGIHTEDSPDYHFFAHERISNMLAAPWWAEFQSGEIDYLLENGRNAKAWLVTPTARCVPVGDSTSGLKHRDLPRLDTWNHAKQGEQIAAKLDGYAVVRTDESVPVERSSFLFYQGSFYSHAHKHADCLSFVWQERGQNILIDSGKYGYQKDRWRKYFLSSMAHNTITLDKKSFSRSRSCAYGSAIENSPVYRDGYWILCGQVSHAKERYKHRRRIFFSPGKEMFVVDWVFSDDQKTREASLWWHLDPSLSIQNHGKDLVIHGHYNEIVADFGSSSELADIKTYRGATHPFLSGWMSRKYLEVEPIIALRASVTFLDHVIFLTRFRFSGMEDLGPAISLKSGELKTPYRSLSTFLKV